MKGLIIGPTRNQISIWSMVLREWYAVQQRAATLNAGTFSDGGEGRGPRMAKVLYVEPLNESTARGKVFIRTNLWNEGLNLSRS